MKFSRILCFLLSIILIIPSLGVFTMAEEIRQPDTSVIQGSHTLDGENTLLGSSHLVPNTEASLLFEVNSQTLLHGYNIDEKVYPSSLVKLVTLLLVLENADISQSVTVTQEVLNTVPSDAMSVYLSAGETMTIQDLLYCMMVGSGNDAAAVVADAVAGDQVTFVNMMNDLAAELGCTNTNFMNVHGLHHIDQYTTARDIAKFINRGLENEMFRQILGCSNYTVPANEVAAERNLVTNNYLISTQVMEIYYDGRVTGGRTGVANNGSRCIAAIAKSGNMELISLAFGSWSTFEADGYTVRIYGGFNEIRKLLDYGFQGYRSVEIFHKDQILRQYAVSGGDCDLFLATADRVSTVLPSGVGLSDLTFVYKDRFNGGYPVGPIEKGTVLSGVQVWYRDICVVEMDLYAMNSVLLDGPIVLQSKTSDGGIAWWGWVLIVLGIILILYVTFLLAMRYIKPFRKIVNLIRRRIKRSSPWISG